MSSEAGSQQHHSATLDDCALCASAHEPTSTRAPVERRDDVVPWILLLIAAVAVAVVGQATERWFAAGVTLGLAVGAACAWYTDRTIVGLRAAAREREVKALTEDSDVRVGMLIRQYEWAVNDVVALKRSLEHAEMINTALLDRARERERHMRRIEGSLVTTRQRLAQSTFPSEEEAAQPQTAKVDELPAAEDVVRLQWSIQTDGDARLLEFRAPADGLRPARLRIVDGKRGVVASADPLPVSERSDDPHFAVAVPDGLLADLQTRGDTAYKIEALVQYQWKPVVLEDPARATPAADRPRLAEAS